MLVSTVFPDNSHQSGIDYYYDIEIKNLDECIFYSDMNKYLCFGITFLIGFVMISAVFFSVYINIRLLYITIRTFKKESKASHFPILLLMSTMAWPSATCLFIIIIVTLVKQYTDDGGYLQIADDDNTVYNYFVFLVFSGALYAYPMLLAFLDFLLCSHRIFCVFGSFSLMTSKFRWFGPLIFFILFPFIIFTVLLSVGYKNELKYIFGYEYQVDFQINFYYIAFLVESFLKVTFTFMSVGGYLSIMRKVLRAKKRLGHAAGSDEMFIIKQAFPIATSQLVFVILHLLSEAHFENLTGSHSWRTLLDVMSFMTSTIVVPVSVILGNPLKRSIYMSSRCCCRKKGTRVHIENSAPPVT